MAELDRVYVASKIIENLTSQGFEKVLFVPVTRW